MDKQKFHTFKDLIASEVDHLVDFLQQQTGENRRVMVTLAILRRSEDQTFSEAAKNWLELNPLSSSINADELEDELRNFESSFPVSSRYYIEKCISGVVENIKKLDDPNYESELTKTENLISYFDNAPDPAIKSIEKSFFNENLVVD